MTAPAFSISSDQLLVWGANVLLQVTLVTAVALVVAATVRRSPAVRHWVLCSSLLLVLFSPVIALVMQLSGNGLLSVSLVDEGAAPVSDPAAPEPSAGSRWAETSSSREEYDDSANTGNPALGLAAAAPDRAIDVTSVSAPPEAIASGEGAIAASPAPQRTTTPIGKALRVGMPPLLFVWLAGAVFLSCRLAVGRRRFAAILRSARPNTDASLAESFEQVGRGWRLSRMPELLLSERVSGPVSVGLLHPRVVLPERLVDRVTRRQLRDILVHEVAHIVRRDQVVVLLQKLAATIFWVHPLVSALNRELARAREEVCDNYVLAATDAPSYSRTLLRLVELAGTVRPSREAVGLFASCWKLERRVAGLLDERRNRVIRLTTAGKTLGVALSLVMATIVAMGTMTPAVAQTDNNYAATSTDRTETRERAASNVSVVATEAPQDAPPASTPKTESDTASNTTTIRGTILRPDGEPAAGAFVSVVGVKLAGDVWETSELLAEGVADGAGRYELSLEGVSSKTHAHPNLIARTEQSGIAWHSLNLDADQTTLDVKLKPQQLIQVRLVDAEGQPVAELPVELSAIMVAGGVGRSDQGMGVRELTPAPKAWLAPVKTDGGGLLTIGNVAAGHGVVINIPGTEKYAPQQLSLNTGMPEQRPDHDHTYRSLVKNMKPGEVATIPLAPAQFFEGVVLLGGSDNPAANSRIAIHSTQQEGPGSWTAIEGKTDEAGRFRLNPRPGVRFNLIAYPPEGTPYQVRRLDDLRWSPGAGPKSIEIRLGRGVLARGKVVDAQTGRPLGGASVQYHPDRANNTNLTSGIVTGWQGIQETDDAGEFAIPVLPGPGTLLVHAAEQNYILQEVDSRELDRGEPGGVRTYAHAFRKIDPAAGEPFEALKIALTPGASVRGTLTDAKGDPIDRALVVSRLKISPRSPCWRGFPHEAPGGTFEISGLRDGEEYPVHFLDPENRLGATAMISTKNPSPTIALEPCGSAIARFVDPEGKPVSAGLRLGLQMVVTPGRSRYDFQAARRGETLADEDFVSNVDQVNYRPAPTTNAKGEMTFPVLIPGARYRFIGFVEGKPHVASEFVAESGETYDMGDVEVHINK